MNDDNEIGPGRLVGAMRADEVATLIEWAAKEHWNPGLADVGIAWSVDPAAFIAVRERGELIAGGTILSYDGAFGFMGLFIVRQDLRGAGLGTSLWQYRRDRLIGRLAPGASIGMDGVFGMVPFYERGGFVLAHRDLRLEGTAHGARDPSVVALSAVGFPVIDSFDRKHVAAPRSALLRRWLEQRGAHGGALLEDERLVAYGVVRPCRVGYRFGPFLAERADLAERLMGHLLAAIEGEPVQIDVPEPNEAGLGLARESGLVESFGCARMYLGGEPDIPLNRVFGVTSFEFG